MSAWVLALPALIALVAVLALPCFRESDDEDAMCARVDEAIDRENAGWRNT